MHQITLALIFILTFPTSASQATDHAIYISVVEVSHASSSEIAVIKVKVFTDDFEDGIMNESNKRVDFTNSSACEKNRTLIENYFWKHFRFSINSSRVKLLLERCENNGDAIWLQFKINCPPVWNEIDVMADYLMELFPTQSNVISIYHGDKKRFIRLTEAKPTEIIKF